MTTIPELERGCNSWIATSPNTGKPVELYERADVEILAAHGWTVQTALQYLTDINARTLK